MDENNRGLATGAHHLRRKAKLLGWLFKSQDHNSEDSVISAATALRSEAERVRRSKPMEDMRSRVRLWEAQWTDAGDGPELLARLRSSYPALIGQIRAALATHGTVDTTPAPRSEPARVPPPMPSRHASGVAEELVTFRVVDQGGYVPAPPRPPPASPKQARGQPGRWVPPGQAVEQATVARSRERREEGRWGSYPPR